MSTRTIPYDSISFRAIRINPHQSIPIHIDLCHSACLCVTQCHPVTPCHSVQLSMIPCFPCYPARSTLLHGARGDLQHQWTLYASPCHSKHLVHSSAFPMLHVTMARPDPPRTTREHSATPLDTAMNWVLSVLLRTTLRHAETLRALCDIHDALFCFEPLQGNPDPPALTGTAERSGTPRTLRGTL